MNIEDLIESVCNANVLVRRDRPPEKVGGVDLPDATRTASRMTSGEVLAVGPECQSDLYPGKRILFGEFAGSSPALEGIQSESHIVFLADTDIFATLKDDAPPRPEDALALPIEWMPETTARPAHLLVERAEMPIKRGMLHLPLGARTHTRATEAVVRDVGAAVAGFAPDERVQLAGQGGKRIAFGSHGQRELWAVSPKSVLAKYREAPPSTVVMGNPGFDIPHEILDDAFGDKVAISEGDPRGLR